MFKKILLVVIVIIWLLWEALVMIPYVWSPVSPAFVIFDLTFGFVIIIFCVRRYWNTGSSVTSNRIQ